MYGIGWETWWHAPFSSILSFPLHLLSRKKCPGCVNFLINKERAVPRIHFCICYALWQLYGVFSAPIPSYTISIEPSFVTIIDTWGWWDLTSKKPLRDGNNTPTSNRGQTTRLAGRSSVKTKSKRKAMSRRSTHTCWINAQTPICMYRRIWRTRIPNPRASLTSY